MARRDLTNQEVEEMGRDNPGSAAEYLRLRREELEAEEAKRREEDDEERFVEAFVAAGGERSAARKVYREGRNEQATWTATLAAESTVEQVRSRISGAL